jgi:hypothetical protein
VAIVSSWCHQWVLAGERQYPSWSGAMTVPLGTLPLQWVSHLPTTAEATTPRKVLLPRRNVTPLLHEALAWHGFQVEQQPISCQDLPSWLKRMHDPQLAMPLCLGLVAAPCRSGWRRRGRPAGNALQRPQRKTMREMHIYAVMGKELALH